MNGFCIRWHNEIDLDAARLTILLRQFGALFQNQLQERVDMNVYAEKLLRYADIALATTDNRIVGFLAIYANNKSSGRAHVPLVAILPSYRGRGIARAMLARAAMLAGARGMHTIDLEVAVDNSRAKHLYSTFGFRVTEGLDGKEAMEYKISADEVSSGYLMKLAASNAT